MGSPGTPWTPEEDAALRLLYPQATAGECAREIGRSKGAVTARASALGLRRPRKTPAGAKPKGPREWSAGETMRLFECWGRSLGEAARRVGRPEAEVAERARRLRVPIAGAAKAVER